MNCYDGFRVDCFPENSSQVYGIGPKLGCLCSFMAAMPFSHSALSSHRSKTFIGADKCKNSTLKSSSKSENVGRDETALSASQPEKQLVECS